MLILSYFLRPLNNNKDFLKDPKFQTLNELVWDLEVSDPKQSCLPQISDPKKHMSTLVSKFMKVPPGVDASRLFIAMSTGLGYWRGAEQRREEEKLIG